MKLERIETFTVKVPPPSLGGNYFYFIKLYTDDGVIGWGETSTVVSGSFNQRREKFGRFGSVRQM